MFGWWKVEETAPWVGLAVVLTRKVIVCRDQVARPKDKEPVYTDNLRISQPIIISLNNHQHFRNLVRIVQTLKVCEKQLAASFQPLDMLIE